MDQNHLMKSMQFNRSYILGMVIFSFLLGIFLSLFFATRNALDSASMERYYVGISILFTFLVSICISLGSFPYFRIIVAKFPWQSHPFQRGGLMLLGSTLIPGLIISFWVFVFDKAFGNVKLTNEPVDSVAYFDHIATAIIITVFMVLVYELRSLYIIWREGIIEKEKLRRETIEYQYNALTTQLDPHFLFNSLNVLSSLVRAKDEGAVRFIDNFSDIYRYVLNAKNEVALPLKEELAFVEKYLNLQKLRYLDNLQFVLNIQYEDYEKLVPPLSVQLLVENAIKHNVTSSAKPLNIVISTKNETLTVSNTYQPRKHDESNGMGHKILEQRFSHLTDVVPVFSIENNTYMAQIPLLHEDE